MTYSEEGSGEKGLISPITNILIYAYKILLNLKYAFLFPLLCEKKRNQMQEILKF